MKKALWMALLAGVGLGISAQADQGTTAASFLKLATGPRVIAMGGSFAGLADDVNALNYNPAGLAFVDDKEFTFMHAFWFQDIFFDQGGVTFPLGNIGTIGANVLYLNGGSFDKYTLDPITQQPVANGQFTAADLSAGISYSRTIFSNLSAGILAKFINESIDTSSATGFAVDLSAFYRSPIPNLSLGLSIQNLGPPMGFSQTYSLPINFRLGIGYKPLKDVAVAVDYVQPIETAGIISAGFEYGYRGFLFVRGGYAYQGAIDFNQVYTGFGPDVAAGLSLGLGLKYKGYYLDYAYVPFGFLGTTHRIGFTFKL